MNPLQPLVQFVPRERKRFQPGAKDIYGSGSARQFSHSTAWEPLVSHRPQSDNARAEAKRTVAHDRRFAVRAEFEVPTDGLACRAEMAGLPMNASP